RFGKPHSNCRKLMFRIRFHRFFVKSVSFICPKLASHELANSLHFTVVRAAHRVEKLGMEAYSFHSPFSGHRSKERQSLTSRNRSPTRTVASANCAAAYPMNRIGRGKTSWSTTASAPVKLFGYFAAN